MAADKDKEMSDSNMQNRILSFCLQSSCHCLLTALLLAPLAALHAAELKLATLFSDHMVLQREKPVAVWGWADAGESVTVAFDGRTKTAADQPNPDAREP